MADRATIARPYARAAFAHAEERKDLPGWSKLLGSAAAVAADSRVARLIGNPHVTGDERIDENCGSGGNQCPHREHGALTAEDEERLFLELSGYAGDDGVDRNTKRQQEGKGACVFHKSLELETGTHGGTGQRGHDLSGLDFWLQAFGSHTWLRRIFRCAFGLNF